MNNLHLLPSKTAHGLQRTVMEQQYGFTVSAIPGNVLATDNVTSYTFHIIRDSLPENEEYFENLVILIDSLDQPSAYTIKYIYTQVPEYIEEDDAQTLHAIKELTPITYNDGQARISYVGEDGCSVLTLMCPYKYPHPATLVCIGEGRDTYWEVDSSNCPRDWDEGGGDSGGGNTDDGSDAPIITVPVSGSGSGGNGEIAPPGPCDELNKLTGNQTYQPNGYMDSQDKRIRGAILGMPSEINPINEAGYALYNQGNYNVIGPFANYTAPPPGVGNQIYFPPKPYLFGTIHTHPIDGKHVPMFSHDDLYSLYAIASNYQLNQFNSAGNDLFVCIMVVEIGGQDFTYAIKIEDFSKLEKLRYLHPSGNGSAKKWNKYGDILLKNYVNYANGANGSKSQYERTLLKFIKTQDIGISLYEMNRINQGTPFASENWTKLELEAGDEKIKKLPCGKSK